MARTQNRGANGRLGSKWIARVKRLAIYLRDGMACAWCGAALEDGVQLTLDHLETGHKNHHEFNLVTACTRCNSSRGARSVEDFSQAVALYLDHGVQASAITTHIAACAARDLAPYRVQAREAIARRGSYRAAMASQCD